MPSVFSSPFAAQQVQIELAQAFGRQAIEATRRLLALNLQTLRTLLGEGGARLQAVTDGDSPLAADEDVLAPARQAAERTTAYWVQACEIVAGAQQELMSMMQRHADEMAAAAASPTGAFAALAAFGVRRAPAPDAPEQPSPRRTIETAQAAFERVAGSAPQASATGTDGPALLN